MTQSVFWPHEQANAASSKKVEVTIVAWDYEQKRGTAMLPGGQVVEVQQVTALTIIESQQFTAPSRTGD
jgi:hypothetical protein